MPGATSRRAIPYPVLGDAANISALQPLAEALDNVALDHAQGTSVPLAGAGVAGDYFYKTDDGSLYRHNGTSWVELTPKDAAAGTASLRTLGTGATQALPGNHASTTNERVPTDGSVTAIKVASSLKPSGSAVAGTEALRALGTSSSTAAAGNDSRFPTADEKAALAGSSGSPSGSNKFVTNADSRLSDTRTPTDNTVSTAKIQNLAVTEGKLASNAVTIAKMASSTRGEWRDVAQFGGWRSITTSEGGVPFWIPVCGGALLDELSTDGVGNLIWLDPAHVKPSGYTGTVEIRIVGCIANRGANPNEQFVLEIMDVDSISGGIVTGGLDTDVALVSLTAANTIAEFESAGIALSTAGARAVRIYASTNPSATSYIGVQGRVQIRLAQ